MWQLSATDSQGSSCSTFLLNRKQAASYLGISVTSFDKSFREEGCPAFMLGRQERYTVESLQWFVKQRMVTK